VHFGAVGDPRRTNGGVDSSYVSKVESSGAHAGAYEPGTIASTDSSISSTKSRHHRSSPLTHRRDDLSDAQSGEDNQRPVRGATEGFAWHPEGYQEAVDAKAEDHQVHAGEKQSG
jgi:hypothetical protein